MPGKADNVRKGIRWSCASRTPPNWISPAQPGIAWLGRLSYEAQHGLYAYLTLMATPQRLALGVMDAWMWARQPKDASPVPSESSRWKEGYTIVADTAADGWLKSSSAS